MESKFLADVNCDYDDEWLIRICARDNTQAGLMNVLVDALVEKYAGDE